MDTRELRIEGMSCGHCVATVRDALTQVPGIEVRDVVIGKAVVAFDQGSVTDGALVDAVDDAGYSATVVG
jgi:copper chaperone CopZ